MFSYATIAATLMASVVAVPTGGSHGGHNAAHYSLPALSGPHCVGKTHPVVLTDSSRNDPFNNNTDARREVIVTLYYPTERHSSYGKHNSCPGGGYATPGFASWVSEFLSGNVSADYIKAFQTHSVVGVPFKNTEHKGYTPLLLYSHGLGVPSKLNQAVIEDVVSHGYIVALMSHPWDSDYEEFPDGRVVRQSPILKSAAPGYTPQTSEAVDVRAADTLFVLDSIKAGKLNKIPGGCDISALADRAGMFGHSLGGQLSLVVMLQTQRIIAGTNMDGWFWNGANATNLTDPSLADAKRPYLNMRADPALIPPFLRHAGGGPENHIDAMRAQTGPKVQPIVAKTGHYAYCDLTQLSIPAQDKKMEKETAAFQGWVGTVDPRRMHKITSRYHTWFFDIAVKGKGKEEEINEGLKYPEVTFGPIRR